MADFKEKVAQETESVDFAKASYRVKLETNHGDIELELFPDVAPGHCRNLIGLVRSGFYDGLSFHRIIPGFVIQGGCPEGTGAGGPGYTIEAEFNDKPHDVGVLSMARTQDPHSAGSQFFLCLGRVSYLDGNYTVFGQTADDSSKEVVLKIGSVETGEGDKPLEDVKINKATVTEALH